MLASRQPGAAPGCCGPLVTSLFSQIGPVFTLCRRLCCAFLREAGWTRGQPRGGSWVVSGRSRSARVGVRHLSATQVEGRASSSVSRSLSAQKVFRRPSRWPGVEESAPPFPKAEPYAPLGSAPSAVPAVAAGGARFTRQTRPPLLPFPSMTWPGSPSSELRQGWEKQGVKTARGGSRLRLWAQRAVSGRAGVLPVWPDCGVRRGQWRGWGCSVVLSGASRGLPHGRLPSLSPLSAGLRRPSGLWPGLHRRGPSRPRGPAWSEHLLRTTAPAAQIRSYILRLRGRVRC